MPPTVTVSTSAESVYLATRFSDVANAGVYLSSVHPSVALSCEGTLKKIKELGAKPALAINPETPMETLRPYLQYCEEVVVMSVHPGFGGQSFIEASFDRIKELRDMRAEMGLDFAIEVDGGIKLSNVEDVLKCGADIIVAGSAVFKKLGFGNDAVPE